MAKRKRIRLSVLLELFLDTILLLGFMIQAFLVGCLLVYGYLPLPAGKVTQLINEKLPDNFIVEVEDYRLQTNGTIQAIGIKIGYSSIKQSLFEAESAEIEFIWRGFSGLPDPANLIVTGGTLYTPSVYSPNGYHTPLLERIALRMRPDETGFVVDRFAALHDVIRLRGAIDLPASSKESTPLDPEATIQQFYTQAAKLLQQKELIRHFRTPTITFNFILAEDGSQKSLVRASSLRLDHPEIKADQIQLKSHLNWDGEALSTIQSPLLTATSLSIPRYEISGKGVAAEIPPNSVATILHGNWPHLRLAADSLTVDKFELDAPIFTLSPSALPQLQFRGATRSLNGAIDLKGQLDTNDWSGNVRARGSVDLAKLAAGMIPNQLPGIRFQESPYLDLNLNFGKKFSLKDAQLSANINDLIVSDLHFDHIRADGSFHDGIYSIDDLYLRRQDQWLDLKFSLDSKSDDYRVTLIGSAVPYDYNTILPRWWETIFRDFDFSRVSYSLGDFIIYGNTKRKSSDLYFGSVEAHDVSYRGVFLEKGELIVRGRGPYTELHQLRAQSAQGWARGEISFASKLDQVNGPASVRLKMDAKLTLDDAAKLFGENIASIISEFETEALPVATLEGAIFNKAYTQYAGKSFFDLSATCNKPLIYKGIPLDYLNFHLYGRSEVTHLRNLQFGYSDGHGQAALDVLTPSEGVTTVRYGLKLVGADQNLAISNLPQLDNIEDSLGTIEGKNIPYQEREEALADIEIHGKGPADDIFAHNGFGRIEIRSEKLGTIQLLGTLSRMLQSNQLNFTSFNLNLLRGVFEFNNEVVDFEELQIDGPLTQIASPGTLNLRDQSLNMRVSVNLFKNAGDSASNIRRIGEWITKPIPNLLVFELTGTIQKQKLRSLYDPRNLIPNSLYDPRSLIPTF